MPIALLTDNHYFELAKAALAAVGRDIVAEGLEDARRTVADCKRVHRLLAVDGQRAEDLTTAEQLLATSFAGLALAKLPEYDRANPTGNFLPAVELPEEPEGSITAPPMPGGEDDAE